MKTRDLVNAIILSLRTEPDVWKFGRMSALHPSGVRIYLSEVLRGRVDIDDIRLGYVNARRLRAACEKASLTQSVNHIYQYGEKTPLERFDLSLGAK